jgi:hypothetical protein
MQAKTLRPEARLNSKLDARLAAYMAAGLGTLASANPAQAKVVYTQTNTTLTSHYDVFLDLNNDGVGDFSFSQFSYGGWDHFYFFPKVKGNAVLEEKGPVKDPAALRAGVPIGPKGDFNSSPFQLLAKCGGTSGFDRTSGDWNEVTNRYLGLRFLINGEVHYGWARLTVTGCGGLGATLTGYAYETIPNKRILAGQTSGTDEVAASVNFEPRQPSLGLLARGAYSPNAWRREE